MEDEKQQANSSEPRKVPSLMTASWEATTTEQDPLVALGAARALVALLTTWEAQLVGEAVADGATWESIGGTYGVSRQAAWERFHHDVHDFRRRVKGESDGIRNRHRKEMHEFRESIRSEARRMRHGH